MFSLCFILTWSTWHSCFQLLGLLSWCLSMMDYLPHTWLAKLGFTGLFILTLLMPRSLWPHPLMVSDTNLKSQSRKEHFQPIMLASHPSSCLLGHGSCEWLCSQAWLVNCFGVLLHVMKEGIMMLNPCTMDSTTFCHSPLQLGKTLVPLIMTEYLRSSLPTFASGPENSDPPFLASLSSHPLK